MSQEQINLALSVLASSPLVLYIVQQFLQRRKNKVDFGDDLLDTMNKTVASLKTAREDLRALEQELRTSDKEHAQEVELIEKAWRERQDGMRARIKELEKVIVKYEITFTLTTHPNVAVTDLKVVSKEDVTESQKLKAITDAARNEKK